MSKKKIIFDSVALGLNVLLFILFAIPLVEGISVFNLMGLIGNIDIGNSIDISDIFELLVILSAFLLMIFVIINIIAMTLALLCDLNVIKNEKLSKAMKTTAHIFSVINIALAIIFAYSAIVALSREASTIVTIILYEVLAIAIVVLTKKSKLKKAKNETEVAEKVSLPAEENKTEEEK